MGALGRSNRLSEITEPDYPVGQGARQGTDETPVGGHQWAGLLKGSRHIERIEQGAAEFERYLQSILKHLSSW